MKVAIAAEKYLEVTVEQITRLQEEIINLILEEASSLFYPQTDGCSYGLMDFDKLLESVLTRVNQKICSKYQVGRYQSAKDR